MILADADERNVQPIDTGATDTAEVEVRVSDYRARATEI